MAVVLGEQAAFPPGRGRAATISHHAADAAAPARDAASMTPPRRRWRALRLGLGVALGLIVLLAGAVASHPWWLAPSLGAYLSKTSGREVHFDKVRLGLSDSLAPEAVFEGVRIANAPWADAGRPFAVLARPCSSSPGTATTGAGWSREWS